MRNKEESLEHTIRSSNWGGFTSDLSGPLKSDNKISDLFQSHNNNIPTFPYTIEFIM